MSTPLEEKDWPGPPEEAVRPTDGTSVPMKMQLFSTWEVRKVPANCVPRLCTLTVAHLKIVRSLESSPTALVLAVSMKSPHRTLRSNEISLPPSGLVDIPLELTFSLQYPHFLKRGGNVLQIRLQRRKRYRNRPLGGYKSLAIGKVDMSSVLQHSFQGLVRLYSEKVTDHVAEIVVSSLSSTAVDVEVRSHLAEGSSEEDEDDIILFSDDLGERGSDSESGDNMEQPPFEGPHGKTKNRLKPSVLRLLRLSRPKDGGVELVTALGLTEAVAEDRESAVTFASSISDSEEEEEGLESATPPRPMLSPFFSSDRCSMVSLPTTAKSAESVSGLETGLPALVSESALSRKYGSLEEAITEGYHSMETGQTRFVVGEQVDGEELDIRGGQLWIVEGDALHSQAVAHHLGEAGRLVVNVSGDEGCVNTLQSLLATVERQWEDQLPFSIVLYGTDTLVAGALLAFVHSSCPVDRVRFTLLSPTFGQVPSHLSVVDELYQTSFPPDGQWTVALQDSVASLLSYVKGATHTVLLPLAQVTVQRIQAETGTASTDTQVIPFFCAISVGGPDNEVEPSAQNLPTSPTGGSSESPEVVVECWMGKKEGQKVSVKTRGVVVSVGDGVLNVTTVTRERKVKGIRIRRKETDINTFTASHLVCKPVSKQECISVAVDGVEYEGVISVKVTASCEQTTFPVALSST